MNEIPQLAGNVLITFAGYDLDHPEEGGLLQAAGLEAVWSPRHAERTADDIAAAAAGCIGAIVDVDPFDASVFERVPELRVVSRTGVGFDAIDIEAATEAGVVVTTTPGVNHDTVADHTISMMLACLRRTVPNDSQVRAGRWERIGIHAGWDLHHTTVGLIGCGRIGGAVAQRLLGFDARVLVHDPVLEELPGCELVDLDTLVRESDIVSLHTPLTAETRHIVDAELLAAMKPDAILINTSRGGLLDEPAVLDALEARRLRSAGLDVFEVEPPSLERLATLDSVVLSPHIAGMSASTIAAMSRGATRNLIDVLSGVEVPGMLNPEALRVAEVDRG